MKKVYQKYFHIPGKQNGDCWRAAIASVIECDIEDLPIPIIRESWSEYCLKMDNKLAEMGWENIQYPVRCITEGMLSSPDTNGYVLALGKSPRFIGRNESSPCGVDIINHYVVWKNGLVHDPHPENKGIMDIIDFEVLKKIS